MTRPVILTDRDLSVLEALKCSYPPSATYMVRYWSRGALTTPQVLRSLKKLERAGRVERVSSRYLVMICWNPISERGLA
jgi:DNA-binding MarR family transcriptional regulator